MCEPEVPLAVSLDGWVFLLGLFKFELCVVQNLEPLSADEQLCAGIVSMDYFKKLSRKKYKSIAMVCKSTYVRLEFQLKDTIN